MSAVSNTIPRDLLSIKDTTHRIGTSQCTVRRWITQPTDPLPHYRIGGRIRISESELAGWINRRSGRGGTSCQ